VASGDRLPYLPEHLVHAELGLAGERWRLGLAANYLDDMLTVAGGGNGERTDSAVVWDLTGGYQLTDQVELYARVENLSDETYVVARRPAGARPGQPRSGFVGVRVGF
jgi:Fe(3+) dicitrate transport protein